MEKTWPPVERFLKHRDLAALRMELAKPESRWTDDDLLHLAEVYRPSQNAEGAAFGFLELIASICPYRPHLVEKLLVYPMGALVALDITSHERALRFVKYHFDRKAWYGWLTWRTYFPSDSIGAEGRKWLKEELPKFGDAIQHAIEEVLRRNEEILADNEDD